MAAEEKTGEVLRSLKKNGAAARDRLLGRGGKGEGGRGKRNEEGSSNANGR